MIKPLSELAQAELGISETFRGKLWAFTAVTTSSGVGLGIAIANERGYVKVPEFFCSGDNYTEMARHADALNAAKGLDIEAAAQIVCSSMAIGRTETV